MGKKPQRHAPIIKRIAPRLRVVATSHCPLLALNYPPARRPESIEKLRKVAGGLKP